ncbi:MAG: FAD/NAD(P)-binding protein [Candidatus Micrarchaeia archaeon]
MKDEAHAIRTLRVRIKDKKQREKFSFKPGQFIQVTVFGVGEAPFSISSDSGFANEFFEVTIKKVGNVSVNLHKLKPGGVIGVRGPFGNFFPLNELEGRDLVFLAGGLGIAPVRSTLLNVLSKRKKFGSLALYYAARTPQDVSFSLDLENWRGNQVVDVYQSVDEVPSSCSWNHFIGRAPALLHHYKPLKNSVVLACGPPLMMKFCVEELEKQGFSPDNVIVSLERNMRCGIGKCGHCMARGKYVCRDGPVFSWSEAIKLKE